jgi:hypothetical protein
MKRFCWAHNIAQFTYSCGKFVVSIALDDDECCCDPKGDMKIEFLMSEIYF